MKEETICGSCLNALRLLADPEVKTAAHITVKVPFRLNWSDYGLEKAVGASYIRVCGTYRERWRGKPFVSFECGPPPLKKLWRLDNGQPFYPHITLYHGGSLDIANLVFDIVSSFSYHFRFSGKCFAVSKKTARRVDSPYPITFCPQIIEEIVGINIDPMTICGMTLQMRLDAIGKICGYISCQSTMAI